MALDNELSVGHVDRSSGLREPSREHGCGLPSPGCPHADSQGNKHRLSAYGVHHPRPFSSMFHPSHLALCSCPSVHLECLHPDPLMAAPWIPSSQQKSHLLQEAFPDLRLPLSMPHCPVLMLWTTLSLATIFCLFLFANCLSLPPCP